MNVLVNLQQKSEVFRIFAFAKTGRDTRFGLVRHLQTARARVMQQTHVSCATTANDFEEAAFTFTIRRYI